MSVEYLVEQVSSLFLDIEIFILKHTHTHVHTHISLIPFNSIIPLAVSYSTTEPCVQGRRRFNDPPGIQTTTSMRPFCSFTVLGFINSAFYFLYCSAAVVLFITACDRCLEAGDKHRHTALLSTSG